MKKKSFFAAFIGNILEHYDTALYALLAPYFAPLFFPQHDFLTALIYAYAFVPLGLIAKPMGALVFGMVGDRFGRRKALSLSLVGTACATVLMGCLPIGFAISPWLLCLSRVLQGFFSASEAAGGAIFLLEKTAPSRKTLLSGLYDASTIVGILLATFLVFALGKWGDLQLLWRLPFFLSALTAFVGLWLRNLGDEERLVPIPMKDYVKSAWKERRLLLPFIFCSGFTYVTYSFAFPFMNSYLPLVSELNRADVMKLQTLFLLLELLLLPLFGFLANFFTKEKWMRIAALSMALITPILFYLLPWTSPFVLQGFIVVMGAAFGSIYYAWAEERTPREVRYSIISFGGTIGKQLLGIPSIAISLFLYQKTGWVFAPGLYLSLIACAALIAIRRPKVYRLDSITP